MKLYLVRHGQSVMNAQRVHQVPSAELSEQGLTQSRVLARRFQHIPIDLVLASPFVRAQQTAEMIAKIVGKQVETKPELSELKRPSVVEGRPMDEPTVVKIKASIEENAHDPSWRHSDEETFFDAKKRAEAFIESLDEVADEHVLIVTHAHFIRMLTCVMVFGDDLTPALHTLFVNAFAMHNTSITECEKKPEGQWRVLQWNNDGHLGA